MSDDDETLGRRCRFCLHSIEDYGTTIKTYRFMAVYDATIPTSQRIVQKIPAGELKITIEFPALDPFLRVGAFYYLDLSPAPDSFPGLTR